MRATSTARLLLGLAAMGLAAACGGSTTTDEGDGGGRPNTAGGSSGAPNPGPGGVSSGGSSGGFAGSSGSSGGTLIGSSSGSPGEANDSGCSANPLTSTPGGAFNACWSCVAKACATELMACSGDCQCNAAVAAALECETNGADPVGCIMSSLGNDQVQNSVANCILNTGAACDCLGAAPVPADGGCVQTGGGSSGGNGQCTSDFSETCGSTGYQIVCACPQGSCACFGESSTTVISYAGCPTCPGIGVDSTTMADLLTRCGFPH
jgi:hypothetical protein